MSESSAYSASSGTCWLGSRSYRPATPVPCVSPLQIGLWMCCVRIGSSVGSKAIGSDNHQCLCIALGAFRTSPAQSLYAEAYEPFLASRRLKLASNYVLKLKSLPFSLQLSFRTWKCQAMWRISVENFTSRYSTSGGKFKINRNLIDAVASLDIAPWTLSAPTVRFDPTKFKKIRQTLKLTNSFIYNLLQNIPRQKKGFTDSSKTLEGVTVWAVSNKRIYPLPVSFQTTAVYILLNYELLF